MCSPTVFGCKQNITKKINLSCCLVLNNETVCAKTINYSVFFNIRNGPFEPVLPLQPSLDSNLEIKISSLSVLLMPNIQNI